MNFTASAIIAVLAFGVAQQVTKQDVPGVTNFARLETTIACGGATKPEAVPAPKQMGNASLVNMRLATEAGPNVEAEKAAAKGGGNRHYHIPFNGSAPRPTRGGQI